MKNSALFSALETMLLAEVSMCVHLQSTASQAFKSCWEQSLDKRVADTILLSQLDRRADKRGFDMIISVF